MFGKMKLRKSDILFSQYIKQRDHHTCLACGTPYPEKSRGLHCSHYFGRGRENTRLDPDNCISLCFFCHQRLGHGDERDRYKALMLRWLGEKKFRQLEIRANLYKKRDDQADLFWVEQLLCSMVCIRCKQQGSAQDSSGWKALTNWPAVPKKIIGWLCPSCNKIQIEAEVEI